jgi:flagellar motor switch protein FliN/FliY
MSTGTQKVLAVDFRGYVQAWADTLAAILTSLSGTSTSCEVVLEAVAEKPSAEGSYWISGTISGQTPGTFSIRIPQPAIQELLKNNKTDAAVEPANLIAALREIFDRATGDLSTTIGLSHAVREVSQTSLPELTSAASCWLRLNASPIFLLELQVDSRFAAALRPASAPQKSSPQDAAATLRPSTDGTEDKLEVLRHVELAVSMRFGGRRMLLRDILDLCAGSIVELDQQVQEPVDLLLDGRLIARGEVVVVDGNYGLRVTEVPLDAGK